MHQSCTLGNDPINWNNKNERIHETQVSSKVYGTDGSSYLMINTLKNENNKVNRELGKSDSQDSFVVPETLWKSKLLPIQNSNQAHNTWLTS